MKKLKLQLEDLRIDSFHTTTAEGEKGTVIGEQQGDTRYTYCTCEAWPTCRPSECGGDSCEEPCDPESWPFYLSCRPDCGVSALPTYCDGFDCS